MCGRRPGGSLSDEAARCARAAAVAADVSNLHATVAMSNLSISRRTYLKLFAGLSAGAMTQFSGLFRHVWSASAQAPSRLRLLVITQPHANTKYWAPRMPNGELAKH